MGLATDLVPVERPLQRISVDLVEYTTGVQSGINLSRREVLHGPTGDATLRA